jgi:hypothetical protein
MNLATRTHLAYFDGHSVEDIANMDLAPSDITSVAALCWEWAEKYLEEEKFAVAMAYLHRGSEILECLPDGEDIGRIAGHAAHAAAASRYNLNRQHKLGASYFLNQMAIGNAQREQRLRRAP